jgi:hypothetical protein
MPVAELSSLDPADLESWVDLALRDADDGEAAAAWRRAVRELRGGPRIGVGAGTGTAVVRAVDTLGARTPGVQLVALVLDPPEVEVPHVPSAVTDALLGVHTVLWATPVGQALGARERRALSVIDAAVRVEARWVVMVDVVALERMSDHPEVELRQVRERLTDEAGGWQVASEDEVPAIAASLRARHSEMTAHRLSTVARVLLDGAVERLDRAIAEEQGRVARLEAAANAEEGALDEARRLGERAAAHTLGVLRRRTEELLLDLRGFLRDLEGDIPGQVRAMADVEQARRMLSHWLDHVVQGWLSDRVAAWRVAVAGDLRDVRVSDEALALAELILPELQPPPFPSEGRWRRAVGLTAGLGGAAVLAAFQLWIPAAVLAGGGLAWSMLDRDPATTRQERLIEKACEAVRRLGIEAERALDEQLQGFEARLAGLGSSRRERASAERAEDRARVEARLRLHRDRLEHVLARREPLLARRAALVVPEGA